MLRDGVDTYMCLWPSHVCVTCDVWGPLMRTRRATTNEHRLRRILLNRRCLRKYGMLITKLTFMRDCRVERHVGITWLCKRVHIRVCCDVWATWMRTRRATTDEHRLRKVMLNRRPLRKSGTLTYKLAFMRASRAKTHVGVAWVRDALTCENEVMGKEIKLQMKPKHVRVSC